MILDDFISLGRTVPEKSKKYGEKVCMAGYSPELRQLLRVYPLPVRFKFPCRSIASVTLERNHLDSRQESWAIKKRNPYQSIRQTAQMVKGFDLLEYLEREKIESIAHLNEQRKSLGILKVESYEPEIKTRKSVQDPNQLQLFDDLQKTITLKTASDYFTIPYLTFFDTQWHTLQIRDWGLYELMRKYERDGKSISISDIRNSLSLTDGWDVYLLVGNMVHYRSTWIIIKTFTFKRQNQMRLFSAA